MFYVEVRELPNALFQIIHSVLGKSELRTAMTVRMLPIYYNSSLFDLILIFNKSGLYYTDQLKSSPDNNLKMGPRPPTVGRFCTRGLARYPGFEHTAG
jgi:hypothetical protein